MAGFFAVSFGQSLTFPNISALISQAASRRNGKARCWASTWRATAWPVSAVPLYAGSVFEHVSIGAPFATAALVIAPALIMAGRGGAPYTNGAMTAP